MFTIIDEWKLHDVVPRFVAENLDKIPFVNADSINVLTLAKKTEDTEARLRAVEQILLTSVSSSDGTNSSIGQCTVEKQGTAGSEITDDFPPLPSPANDGSWKTVTDRKGRQNQRSSTGAVGASSGAAHTITVCSLIKVTAIEKFSVLDR